MQEAVILPVDRTPTKVLAHEFLTAVAVRHPDGSWELNNVGKLVAKAAAAWCRHHRNGDAKWVMEDAVSIIERRFKRADEAVWARYYSQVSTTSVRIVANAGQVAGGILMFFPPLTLVGIIGASVASLLDLSTAIGQAVDGYHKNKDVKKAVDDLLADDTRNSLISVLHHSKNLTMASGEGSSPLYLVAQWLDVLGPFIIKRDCVADSAYFERRMMDMIQQVVGVARSGTWRKIDAWLRHCSSERDPRVVRDKTADIIKTAASGVVIFGALGATIGSDMCIWEATHMLDVAKQLGLAPPGGVKDLLLWSRFVTKCAGGISFVVGVASLISNVMAIVQAGTDRDKLIASLSEQKVHVLEAMTQFDTVGDTTLDF